MSAIIDIPLVTPSDLLDCLPGFPNPPAPLAPESVWIHLYDVFRVSPNSGSAGKPRHELNNRGSLRLNRDVAANDDRFTLHMIKQLYLDKGGATEVEIRQTGFFVCEKNRWATPRRWKYDESNAEGYDLFDPDNLLHLTGESTFTGNTITIEGTGHILSQTGHQVIADIALFDILQRAGTAGITAPTSLTMIEEWSLIRDEVTLGAAIARKITVGAASVGIIEYCLWGDGCPPRYYWIGPTGHCLLLLTHHMLYILKKVDGITV